MSFLANTSLVIQRLIQHMGSMTVETTPLSERQWKAIDQRVRRVDEDRWLSSRYAQPAERRTLVTLYAFAYEAARVRTVVSEPPLGAIRFQWWRDALEEVAEGQAPRQHDVAQAIAEEVAAGNLKAGALAKLLDGYEAAFNSGRREDEPEARLAATAAHILAPAHGWGTDLQQVAPAFAAARRSASKAFGPHVKTAPSAIRPAVAHFRLRKHYVTNRDPGRLKKRLTVAKGFFTGKV